MKRPRKKGKVIRSGGFEVRIYTSKPGCRIAYYKSGKRVFERCGSTQNAEDRAREILAQHKKGVPLVSLQNPHEIVKYERALSILGPLNIDIDQAASDYAQTREVLGNVPLVEVATFYRQYFPKTGVPIQVNDAVEEFLQSLMDGCSEVYIKDMRARLRQLAHSFNCPLHQLTPDKLEVFFDQFRAKSARTFNNFRRALGTFLNYCKKKDYLPDDIDLLRKIQPRKERVQDVAIYSPDELAAMLEKATDKLIPVLVLGGLCGLRTAEILRLEWDAINWQENYVGVRGCISKTGHNRLAPLCDAASEWLSHYMYLQGKVWPESNSVLNRAFKDLAEKIKMDGGWRRNGLRHSFCSYRLALTQNIQQTSIEAGNSPNILRKNYLSVVSMSKAKTWFGVRPLEIKNVVRVRACEK